MKTLVHTLFCLLILSVFFACKSNKEIPKAAPVVNEVKPAPPWVSSRPNNGFKFIGIGFADKNKSSNYQMEAKKNALYDLSSEIKVDISSNSVLYTVQNNNNFNESFNSLIKLSNSDNIEGYQLIDSYENDKQYWVYYQLDKDEYAKQKAIKKQQIISKAANLINLSFIDEKNQDFSNALKKRIQAFGVLTPYLSEEINFDSQQTNGVKTVFDLTALVQQQLQSIQVVTTKTNAIIKPFQQNYLPLDFKLQLKNKFFLQNFPFNIISDEDRVKVMGNAVTDNQGALQIKINYAEAINGTVGFGLNPDINALMGNDSVGLAGIKILKQFINTSTLKVYANVVPVNIFIKSTENNLTKPTGASIIYDYILQKFNGQEVVITSKPELADYIIEASADTKQDLSSDVLQKSYNVSLAALNINLQLKNNKSNDIIYSTIISEIYGYANSLENAGNNAYQTSKLKSKLSEALFFLKRKIFVY
ncbi:MAG: LPP20 family lipoprotein [Bacteroidetes bacterium]|nr:LPP20 family lipoprotein [Bacteroidota bacterium]